MSASASYTSTSPIIRVGFVPLVDAAPLIVAKELGYYDDAGVSVRLIREPGWASIRDKIAMGHELEAAHALAGLSFATSFGIGCIASHCQTGLILSEHGNALTISEQLYNKGIHQPSDLRTGIEGSQGGKLRIAVVHAASSHRFLVHHLFTKAGLSMETEVELITLPPELMPKALSSGTIDAFCAGEPWNSVAIQDHRAYCLATSREALLELPEKVLLASHRFASDREEEHLRLIAATLRACQKCADPKFAPELSEMLSQPNYLGIPQALIRNSLTPPFDRGQDTGIQSAASAPSFAGDDVNRPTVERGNSVLSQFRVCGFLSSSAPKNPDIKIGQIFRSDLFDRAANQLQPAA